VVRATYTGEELSLSGHRDFASQVEDHYDSKMHQIRADGASLLLPLQSTDTLTPRLLQEAKKTAAYEGASLSDRMHHKSLGPPRIGLPGIGKKERWDEHVGPIWDDRTRRGTWDIEQRAFLSGSTSRDQSHNINAGPSSRMRTMALVEREKATCKHQALAADAALHAQWDGTTFKMRLLESLLFKLRLKWSFSALQRFADLQKLKRRLCEERYSKLRCHRLQICFLAWRELWGTYQGKMAAARHHFAQRLAMQRKHVVFHRMLDHVLRCRYQRGTACFAVLHYSVLLLKRCVSGWALVTQCRIFGRAPLMLHCHDFHQSKVRARIFCSWSSYTRCMRQRRQLLLTLGDHTATRAHSNATPKETWDHVALASERFREHSRRLLDVMRSCLENDEHYYHLNRTLCGRLCLYKESKPFWNQHRVTKCGQGGTLTHPSFELYWPTMPTLPPVHAESGNERRHIFIGFGKAMKECPLSKEVRGWAACLKKSRACDDVTDLLRTYQKVRHFHIRVRPVDRSRRISFDGIERSMMSVLQLARRINAGDLSYWLNRVRLGFAVGGKVDMDAFWARSQKLWEGLWKDDDDDAATGGETRDPTQGYLDELAMWSVKAYLFRLFKTVWIGWKKYACYRHTKKKVSARYVMRLQRGCFRALLQHCLFQKSAFTRSDHMGALVLKRRVLLTLWQHSCGVWRRLEAKADEHASQHVLRHCFRRWTQWFVHRLTDQYHALQLIQHASRLYVRRCFILWRTQVALYTRYVRIIHFVQLRQTRRIVSCTIRCWAAEVQRRRKLRTCLAIAELCADAQARPPFVLQFELVERLFERWTEWVANVKAERRELQRNFTAQAYSQARIVTSHFCHWRWAVRQTQKIRQFHSRVNRTLVETCFRSWRRESRWRWDTISKIRHKRQQRHQYLVFREFKRHWIQCYHCRQLSNIANLRLVRDTFTFWRKDATLHQWAMPTTYYKKRTLHQIFKHWAAHTMASRKSKQRFFDRWRARMMGSRAKKRGISILARRIRLHQ
jgi:hypothetical protein